jgi:hypothetical protein
MRARTELTLPPQEVLNHTANMYKLGTRRHSTVTERTVMDRKNDLPCRCHSSAARCGRLHNTRFREVRDAGKAAGERQGHPDEPLSDDELFAKFKANVSCAGISRI